MRLHHAEPIRAVDVVDPSSLREVAMPENELNAVQRMRLRSIALSRWENEDGAGVGPRWPGSASADAPFDAPPLTNVELVQLRIRVIALGACRTLGRARAGASCGARLGRTLAPPEACAVVTQRADNDVWHRKSPRPFGFGPKPDRLLGRRWVGFAETSTYTSTQCVGALRQESRKQAPRIGALAAPLYARSISFPRTLP